MKAPEILSPAGDMERLEIAYEYGADAAYVSGPEFGLRAFAANFSEEGLRNAVALARSKKKRIYVAVNIFPHNSDLAGMKRHMEFLGSIKPDAMIISDLGAFRLARETAPLVPVHVSVQANNLNWMEVAAWKDLGASRVILARELTIDEIREIREKCRDMELEAFVHGAICMSLSGRCLLSNYMTGRDANRGGCAQSCRWSYSLVEEKRPGEYMPVAEDAHGTYIFNSKDLCTINHIHELAKAGLDSFKIEGRMKSPHYVAVTTAAYKKARDAYLDSPAGYRPDPALYEELLKISHREYFPGFYFEKAAINENYASSQYISTRKFIGFAKEGSGNTALSLVRNSFKTGETLEIFTPEGRTISAAVRSIKNADGSEELYAKQDKDYTITFETNDKIAKFSMIRQVL